MCFRCLQCEIIIAPVPVLDEVLIMAEVLWSENFTPVTSDLEIILQFRNKASK